MRRSRCCAEAAGTAPEYDAATGKLRAEYLPAAAACARGHPEQR